MKKYSLSFLSVLSLLVLSACVSQDQADEKMVKGCKAAIEVAIAPAKIADILSTTYAFEDNKDGDSFRRITLKTFEKDGWIEREKEYSCLYAEQWGIAKTSHVATLESLSYDDIILGKKDGDVIGGLKNFMNLVNASQTAMDQ